MNDLVPPVVVLSLLASVGTALFLLMSPAEDVHALATTAATPDDGPSAAPIAPTASSWWGWAP